MIDLANGNHDDIGKSVEYITAEAVDNATETGKIYHTTVDSSKALIIPVSGTLSQVQFRLDCDGKIYSRRRSRLTTESPFPAWGSFVDISAGVDPEFIREIVLQYLEEHGIDITGVERTENRVDAINAQSDDEHYPTAGAVYDYAAPKSELNYLNNQLNQLTNEVNQKANASDIPDVTDKADKSDTYTKAEVNTKLSSKANSSDIPDISGKADKATTLGGYGITDAYTKVQMNFELAKKADVEDIPDISGKADKSTTLAGYGITDGETTANKSSADVAFFCKDWEKYRGCRIENQCAIEYGITVIEDYT